jgi:nickel transport protein
MKNIASVLLLLVLHQGQPLCALAHDLQYRVDEGGAVYVKLFFGDGSDFTFESYEVYRAGEDIPFQVGRTDAKGRLAFLPDQPGEWRVKAFSEDGHGVDFSLSTDMQGGLEDTDKPVFERYARLITGVAVIFGIFGLINLLARRRGGP